MRVDIEHVTWCQCLAMKVKCNDLLYSCLNNLCKQLLGLVLLYNIMITDKPIWILRRMKWNENLCIEAEVRDIEPSLKPNPKNDSLTNQYDTLLLYFLSDNDSCKPFFSLFCINSFYILICPLYKTSKLLLHLF